MQSRFIFKSISILSFFLFLSSNIFCQDFRNMRAIPKFDKLKDLPADFGKNTKPILFQQMDAVIEKKKNGKIKNNYELEFNKLTKEILDEKIYLGKIVPMQESELDAFLYSGNLDPKKNKYVIRYIQTYDTGADIVAANYIFYIYDLWDTKGRHYTINTEGAGYKNALIRFLKKLEKERLKRT